MSTLATQKTVLITGCSEGGIGHSLALEFARQNYHVFATARRLSAMKSLSENPNITLLELDVTSKSSILSASEAVTKATGGTLDVLYHNAGARSIVLAIHSDWKLAEDTFKVNFFAVVEMTRVFIPLILRAGAGSKIVFSNSVAALVPVPTQSIYDASKAALDAYAKVLDLEVRPLGIQVVNVITGEVGTSMAEGKMGVLADDSPYKPIEPIINEVWRVRKTIMPVGDYTRQVVQKVMLSNSPKKLFIGGNSTMVWLVETLGIQWIYGIMFRKEYGLDNLRPTIY